MEKQCIFLVAGRMIYRKGHQFLMDTIKELPEGTNYQCRIVGAGAGLESLKKVCRENKLDNKVCFVGKIPFNEMEEEYRKADVLVMPSIRETTGTVLLEGMSKGLPVITIGKFGGAILLDDDSGWLYEGNTQTEYIENLKTILLECITQPEEVRRKGENARKQAEKHTWQRKLKQYNSIYEVLCKEP